MGGNIIEGLPSVKIFEEGRAEGIAQGKAEGIAQGKAEGIAQGKAEGIAQGKAEGIAQGIAEGIAQGKAEGIAQGKAEGEIIGAVRLYSDELHLKPTEIVEKIKTRFSLDHVDALKYVSEILRVHLD